MVTGCDINLFQFFPILSQKVFAFVIHNRQQLPWVPANSSKRFVLAP